MADLSHLVAGEQRLQLTDIQSAGVQSALPGPPLLAAVPSSVAMPQTPLSSAVAVAVPLSVAAVPRVALSVPAVPAGRSAAPAPAPTPAASTAAAAELRQLRGRGAALVGEPAAAAPLHLGDRLREVDVDAAVVDQHVVHLEVGVLARLGVVELDEAVLKRVARFLVPDYFTAEDKVM